MDKKKIILISMAMGLVLIGLVTMQLFWLKSAMQIKESAFNENIQRIFTEVVEDISILENESSKNRVLNILGQRPIIPKEKMHNKGGVAISYFKYNGKKYAFSKQILTAFTPHGVFDNSLFDNPAWAYRYIDSLISKKLKKNSIFINYNFNVFNEINDRLLYKSSGFKETEFLNNAYAFAFYSNSNAQQIYLMVHFTNQKRFLLREEASVLAISIILILSVISLFWYSLSTIIRQDKLSILKNDFINNMTHEFKTPISTISLACQALSDKDMIKTPELYNAYIPIIAEENRRLGSMAEKILQTALIDKGQLKLNQEWVNVHDVIQDVVKNIELLIVKKGGKLSFSLDAERFIIKADRLHLSNLIYNLLDNANKYTFEDPLIEVGTQKDGDCFKLYVKDNGIGISKANQKKIFDKLYRVPTGNVHNTKGFGLGLSYVKAIVDKHRGVINIHSQLQKGTTFEVRFPFDNERIQC
ncbi:MAG: HAMP domain-containing histidine kinase [Bacteroidales bacterium]|nr:HAMP domain-containing histidine kinase [Bacteroidales bacterium]